MKRNNRAKIIAFLPALGLVTFITGCSPQLHPRVVRFNIIQLSDVYEIGPVDHGQAGGLAGIAALKQALGNENTYVVCCGDLLSPSPMARASYQGERVAGRQMVDVMNVLGLDFATFGNHEFDLEHHELLARLQESRSKWVSSNCLEVDSAQPGGAFERSPKSHRFLVEDKYTKEGIVVALIGLTTDSNQMHEATNSNRTHDGYVQYLEPIPSANAAIDELEKNGKGYNVLIALTHQSLEKDQELAEGVDRIHLILGGHDGRCYVAGDKYKGAPIIKSDYNARAVWVHKCTFNVDSGKLSVESTFQPIGANQDDEGRGRNQTLRAIDKWYDRLSGSLDDSLKLGLRSGDTLGFVPGGKDLDGREERVRSRPTNLTKLIAQSMLETLKKKLSMNTEVNRKVGGLPRLAIFNSGAVRLNDVLRPGPITTYDVLSMLPFPEDSFRGVTMSHCLVKEMLNTRTDSHYQGKGQFLQFFALDEQGNPLVGKDGEPFFDAHGQPSPKDSLPEEPEFLVAVNNFLLDGKERGFAGPEKPDVKGAWGLDLKRRRGDKIEGWDEIRGMGEAQSSVKALIEYLKTNPKIDDWDGGADEIQARSLLGFVGFKLELAPMRKDKSGIRKEGNSIVVLALVNETLVFRVFGRDGQTLVDTDERDHKLNARLIKDLKGRLQPLWKSRKPSDTQKSQILSELVRILGPLTPVKTEIRANKNKALIDSKDLDPTRRGSATVSSSSPITKLEEAIEETQTDERQRLILAEALIHLESRSRLAANEIVTYFRGPDSAIRREAERILTDSMNGKSPPPALIQALLPLLDLDQKSQVDYEVVRADVAELLSKVAPEVMARQKGGDRAVQPENAPR